MKLIRLAAKRSAMSYRALKLLTSLMVLGGALGLSCQIDTYAAKTPSKTNKVAPETKASTLSKKTTPKKEMDQATLKAIEATAQKMDVETRTNLNRLSEAIHQEDKAINNELRDDEELSVTDIGMLWEAAVERSGTIRYAIEKLSRRDATGKPADNDNFSKRVVQNLVHLGGVAGTMWSGTPAGLIGSNMVQNMMSGNPQDSALSRVTDADMVILAKEVEGLQSNLITLYYNYRHAKERLTLSREASATIGKYYDHTMAIEGSVAEALQPLIQSIYDNTKQDEQAALQAFNSSRSALSLVVGPDAVAALEQESKTGYQGDPTAIVSQNN